MRPARSALAALSALAVVAAGLVPAGLVTAAPAGAATSDLFFSEYVEGSANNKALEIFNGTGAAVDLAGYQVQLYSNGATAAGASLDLTGTLADGDAYVVANGAAVLPVAADVTSAVANFNGDDAVALRKDGVLLDVVGQIGTDPGTQWGTGDVTTLNATLRRKPAVLGGDPNGSDAFDPSVQWDGFAQDTFGGLGAHTVDDASAPDAAPAVTSDPADGATDVERDATVTVTFSEPVDADPAAFSLTCSPSGPQPVTVTGGPAAYTVDPDSDLALGDSCTLTVSAAGVTDLDSDDPPDSPATDYAATFTVVTSEVCDRPVTAIHDIQGAGPTSPVAGQTRSTEGVVTGDFQGDAGMRGFFVQDADPDGDPLTSEGVFVFVPPASPFFGRDVQVGDTVHVTGRVTEFQDQTEIDTLTQLAVCGSGTAVPATDVTLPETTDGDLERYEGMKVALAQTLTVQQNFFLGRYGQLTLGAGGRLFQPTNQFRAGTPEAAALADRNRRSLLVLDDATTAQNPSPVPYLPADGVRRAGDTVSGLAGILDQGQVNSNAAIRDYRLQPTSAPTFTNANRRTPAPEPVGGNLTVASFNVLNYFTTFPSAGNDLPRGANDAAEFTRQRTKIFAAMTAIDADVFGLMEIENLPGTHAVQDLVDGLNAYRATPGLYAAVPDPSSGTGTDAIKVAMIYKPSAVTPVGPSLSDPDPVNSRPPLAQAFRLDANGEVASVVVNHLKSKGSCPSASDPDAAGNTDSGDGQGCWNALRVRQAQRLLTFIGQVTTAAGDPDVLAIGDFNSYGHEDPIEALTAAGLVNEIEKHVGDTAYSYVFDGLAGYLDHGLATAAADRQVVAATEWHINADEPSVIDYNTEFKPDDRYAPTPYRSSDHDPVVLGVELGRCQFSDDDRHRVRRLLGDCTTSTTVRVPTGWTLDGNGHSITAYDPRGDHFRGAVVANAGRVANVHDLTVRTRSLADVCDGGADRLRGILLDGASGVLHRNRVLGLAQSGSGCQEGTAIEVRNEPFGPGGDRTGSGRRDTLVAVTANEVRGYQKGGIVLTGSVSGVVLGNTVQGLGRVPYVAQNGVQVASDAAALVDSNTITDNYYTGPADVQSCGVLFLRADKDSKDRHNTFRGNQRNVCRVMR